MKYMFDCNSKSINEEGFGKTRHLDRLQSQSVDSMIIFLSHLFIPTTYHSPVLRLHGYTLTFGKIQKYIFSNYFHYITISDFQNMS